MTYILTSATIQDDAALPRYINIMGEGLFNTWYLNGNVSFIDMHSAFSGLPVSDFNQALKAVTGELEALPGR